MIGKTDNEVREIIRQLNRHPCVVILDEAIDVWLKKRQLIRRCPARPISAKTNRRKR
jgi:hypothetical protein